MAVSTDKMVWLPDESTNAILRFDPSNGVLTPFNVRTLRSDFKGTAADGEGGVWVAALESGKLVWVDRTGKVTEYPVPTGEAGPFALDVDTKRNPVSFGSAKCTRIKSAGLIRARTALLSFHFRARIRTSDGSRLIPPIRTGYGGQAL